MAFFNKSGYRNGGGVFVSLFFHMVLMLLLGLCTFPPEKSDMVEVSTASFDKPQELVTEILDELTDPVLPAADLTPQTNLVPAPETEAEVPDPEIPDSLAEELDTPEIVVRNVEFLNSGSKNIAQDLSSEVLGQAVANASDSTQAVDRMTEEFSQLLWQHKVLVVWCFDQSGSMQADRAEIRGRVDKIYTELFGRGDAQGDDLLTSVVSFGEASKLHMQKPTYDMATIQKAIDEVPVDPSGKEVMLKAIHDAIRHHQKFLSYNLAGPSVPADVEKKSGDRPITFQTSGKLLGRRKMVIILVTDESGNRDENYRYLEETISLARKTDCRIYVLGREASFNHPYYRVRVVDPKTKKVFSVQIDRGPETPMVEVLQTNMFGRRTDVRMSGFGSYEQTRLARSTGGIFFMLPGSDGPKESIEARKNRLLQMREYLPDLESRGEYLKLRKRSPLRKNVAEIVSEMDAWNSDVAKKIHLKTTFSMDFKKLPGEIKDSLKTAQMMMGYYESAISRLQRVSPLREKERSRRWQANYDLLLAELIIYQARTYQYGLALTQFSKKLPALKDKKSNQWRMRTTKKLLEDKRAKEMLAEAKQQLDLVLQEHPGTPWAARVNWELSRGLGMEVYDYYLAPRPKPDPNVKPVTPPKL